MGKREGIKNGGNSSFGGERDWGREVRAAVGVQRGQMLACQKSHMTILNYVKYPSLPLIPGEDA